jgi:hypothetical protein
MDYNSGPSTTSEALRSLNAERERVRKILDRTRNSLKHLEGFITTINMQHVGASQLGDVIDSYNSVGEKLDGRVSELEAQLNKICRKNTKCRIRPDLACPGVARPPGKCRLATDKKPWPAGPELIKLTRLANLVCEIHLAMHGQRKQPGQGREQ